MTRLYKQELCPKCGCSKSSKEHRKCYTEQYKLDGRIKKYNKHRKTIAYRLRLVKKSAKKRNIEFNLKPEDIIIPTHCPVLGIKLCDINIKPMANSPSVDRIDNTKGYLKDNIKVISNRANMLKNNATIEELKKVIKYMESS